MLKYQFQEEVEHGTPFFPLSIYNVDFSEGIRQILPCHWHEENEIIYVYRGSAVFRIDNELFTVHKGEAIVVNSGELHSGYSIDNAGCSYYAVVFRLSFLNSSINDICQNNYLSPLIYKEFKSPNFIGTSTKRADKLIPLLQQIIEKYSTASPGFELFIKGCLCIFFSLLVENGLLMHIQSEKRRSGICKSLNIKKIIQFIERNYEKKVCLNDMAAEVSMSRYNFCRFFKEYTGDTPFEYLNMYRIDKAAKLLEEGSSVTEAALRTGFESLSYFTKMFLRYKNILPSKY